MTGKEYRMSRIFRPDTGNTVILPVDHGLGLGHLPELQRPVNVIQKMLATGIDGVLIADGTFAGYRGHVFEGRSAPTRIVTADTFFANESHIGQGLVFRPQDAIVKGYDAIKAILIWDQPIDERMRNIRMLAKLIREAQAWDLPVMVEPLLMRVQNLSEPSNQQLLSDAVRVAYELGADILKIPFPGDQAVLEKWVGDFTVPLVLLGGGDARTVYEIKLIVQQAIGVGVRGIVMGRSIWGRGDKESLQLMRELVDIVHGSRGIGD